MNGNLKKAFKYYLDHQAELVAQYEGKFIVIKDETVIGEFDSELQAVQETAKIHPLGTFLVQKCERGQESYTHVFHSRVVFA